MTLRALALSGAPRWASPAASPHSKSGRCITGDPGEWWAEFVARQGKAGVPPDHRWKITPVPAGQTPVFAERLEYPLAPTHILQNDIKEGPYSCRTMLVSLARDGNRWAEVVPCANAAAVAAIRAVRAEKARRADRVKALVAGMKPEVRERLLTLVKATTAHDVVDLLVEGTR